MKLFAILAGIFSRRGTHVEDAKAAATDAVDEVFDAIEARFNARCDRLAQRFGGVGSADDLLLGFDGDAIDAEIEPPDDWNKLRAFAREHGVKTHGKSRQKILRALAKK